MNRKQVSTFLITVVLLLPCAAFAAGTKLFVGLGGGGGFFIVGTRDRGGIVFSGFPAFVPVADPWWAGPPWSRPFWWSPFRPPQSPEPGGSGVDPSGALYIEGYRVAPAGWLRVQVEPPDAKVFVDGFPLQVDPASGQSARLGLVVGRHWVEVTKEGFQPQRTEVEIQPAREVVLPVRLGR
jgi:hypothetical protein